MSGEKRNGGDEWSGLPNVPGEDLRNEPRKKGGILAVIGIVIGLISVVLGLIVIGLTHAAFANVIPGFPVFDSEDPITQHLACTILPTPFIALVGAIVSVVASLRGARRGLALTGFILNLVVFIGIGGLLCFGMSSFGNMSPGPSVMSKA